MDPAMFFGRPRTTRQAVKSNQSSSAEAYADREVTTRATRSCVENSRKATKALASVQLKASVKKNVSKTVESRDKKNAKEICEDSALLKPKGQLSITKKKKVQFGVNEKTEADELPHSGPVYKDVRRSDVVGEPSDEYEFPVDENDEPLKKKKKPRKANTAKKRNVNYQGVVLWDPSKKPIIRKCVPSKPVKLKAPKVVGTAPPLTIAITETDGSALDSSKKSQPTLEQPIKVSQDIAKAPRNTTPSNLTSDNSTVARPSSSKSSHSIVGNTASTSKSSTPLMPSEPPLVAMHSMKPPIPSATKSPTNNVGVASALKPASCSSKTPEGVSSLSFNTGNHFSSTPVTSRKDVPNPTVCAVSPASSSAVGEDISNPLQTRISMRTPARASSKVPVICVRESPSFMEPVNPMASSNVNDASCSEGLASIMSSPVTRLKPAQSFKSASGTGSPLSAASASPKEVNYSVPVSNSPVESSLVHQSTVSNDDTFEMLDDIPCTPVVPTRMFSTHRGTMFFPQTESKVTKRKLPALSPSKPLKHARQTTVKFSAPQSASNLDDCFGFDEDPSENSLPAPKPQKKAAQGRIINKQEIKKPNLSIQEVQAILRGQQKSASPAHSTPRTLQTKLTDFVSASPCTPSRPAPKSQSSILTTTPVPLFGEEEIDRELPSPFIQPSRRSYDRFQRGKRIACGDEVHSDEEEGDKNVPRTASSAAPETKKKNRSYRKKKKPADAQLDTWANQLASHFDEVEEIELQVE